MLITTEDCILVGGGCYTSLRMYVFKNSVLRCVSHPHGWVMFPLCVLSPLSLSPLLSPSLSLSRSSSPLSSPFSHSLSLSSLALCLLAVANCPQDGEHQRALRSVSEGVEESCCWLFSTPPVVSCCFVLLFWPALS